MTSESVTTTPSPWASRADEPITVASVRDASRGDDGYFGPDSVTWRVMAHPAALNLGAGLAVLLQILDPGEMQHLARTTVATEGGEASSARFRRTGAYLITVNFGDRAHADAAAAHVDRLHERAVFTDPVTGETSRAKTPQWLRWTHNTMVWGTLTAATEYGLDLTRDEQDRFVVEQHAAANLLHVPGPLPSTRAELDAEILAAGDRAALTLPAADIARALRNPGAGEGPVRRFIARQALFGALAIMPPWARALYGIDNLDERRMRSGKRWMGRLLRAARKNRTLEAMIAEAAAQATAHPYRRVRESHGGSSSSAERPGDTGGSPVGHVGSGREF